jgi:Domain of unknown function (DUF6985)
MERLLIAYRRQRPLRVYWWERMYGADDPILAEALPEISSVEELKALVRPLEFRVNDLRRNQPPPSNVGIRFDAAWDRPGGFGVLLRADQIVAMGPPGLAEGLADGRLLDDPEVDVPPFGRMTCHGGQQYTGLVHFEPLARFRDLAEERETFAQQRQHEFLRPAPPWDFVGGDFELNVYSAEDGTPHREQLAAFEAFMADPQRTADQILAAILDYYRSVFESYREAYGDSEEAERLVPQTDSVEGLRDLITFQSMTIDPPDDDDGQPSQIKLGFACSWEQEHGLGVRWRDGKIEEVGTADILY